MNVVEQALDRKTRITQEMYNRIAETWISKIQESDTMELELYRFSMTGGKCSKCGIDFECVEVRLENANYDFYKPGCECYQRKSEEKDQSELDKNAVENCGIPIKYADCSIKKMNLEIEPETVKAIEEAKLYVSMNNWSIRSGADSAKGLIITGSVGVGKTHVAVSILKYLNAHKKKSGLYVDCSDLRENAIRSKDDYIKGIIAHDVVLLDDFDKLHVQSGSWTSERIFSLINGLVNNNRIILLTCNYDDKGLIARDFGEPISSRLHEACLHIHMAGSNYRLRSDR